MCIHTNNILLFYLDPRTSLKAIGFWPKFGSDKDRVCQLLIEYVNDKSSVTQEEMEYDLCWRQSPVVLFSLKEKPLLIGIYSPPFPPPLITLLFLWFRHQSQHQHYHPRLLPLHLPLPTLSSLPHFNSLFPRLLPFHLFLLTFPPSPPFNSLSPLLTLPQLQKELEQCCQDIEILPFPQSQWEKTYFLIPLSEVSHGGGEIGSINSPLTSSEVQNFKKEL
jgi:hypothetical protein